MSFQPRLFVVFSVLLLSVPAVGALVPQAGVILVVGDVGPTGLVLAREPLTGASVYRPGSGISSGSGTADDPYVMVLPTVSALRMRLTTLHVVIDGVDVDTARGAVGGAAIELVDVSNVTLRESRAVGAPSVQVTTSRDVRLSGNDLSAARGDAVFVRKSSGLTVEGNRLAGDAADPQGGGLQVWDGADVVLRGNSYAHLDEGVTLVRVTRATAEGESFDDVGDAMYAEAADDLRVARVRADRSGGISLNGLRVVAEQNDLAQDDLELFDSPGGLMRDNRVAGSLILYGSPGARIDGGSAGEGVLVGWSPDAVVEDVRVLAGGVSANEASPRVRIARGAIVGGILVGADNATIVDNVVRNGWVGIGVYAPDAHVARNSVSGGAAGLSVGSSTRTIVAHNLVEGATRTAIEVYRADALQLRGNDVRGETGVVVFESRGLRIEGNVLERAGFRFAGSQPAHYRHDIAADNLVAGAPFHYLLDASDVVVPPREGPVLLVNATRVTLEAPSVHDAAEGIRVVDSRDVRIAGGDVSRNALGIYASYTAGFAVENASLRLNGEGLMTWEAEDVRISGSTFAQNEYSGALVDLADGATARIERSTFAENPWVGLWVQDGALVAERILVARNGGLDTMAGIQHFWGTTSLVRASAIRDNANDGAATNAFDADYSGNWWGCAEGPLDPACDGVRGFALLEPWLASAPEDAGSGGWSDPPGGMAAGPEPQRVARGPAPPRLTER